MKSSSYFEERSERRMKKMHDKATKCMSKVNKAYDDSLERLKKEIDHIMSDYSPTEKIDYDRYKDLLQIYNTTKDKRVKAEAKRLIKENSASYRIQRKEALSKAIEIEKLKQVDTQLNLGGKHLKNVYSSVLNDLGGARVSEKYLNEVLNHNWAGSNFSKRVWHNQDVLAKSLESNLLQSFASGKSNKQIADELEYHTNLGRYAANRLIRTETSYMVNSADLESSKQRGIKAKKFQANLDKRTSKICREHNQKVILIDDIKIGVNAPPLHPYCRSFLSDVLEGWDYETEEELQALVSENNVDNTEENGYNINIRIDELTPCLRRLSDNKIVSTTIEKIIPKESEFTNWIFDWSLPLKEGFSIYQLKADGDDRVQGLIALKVDKLNSAVEIGLVESSQYNKNNKEYLGIGGHLFAEAIKQSFENGFDGFVYFDAKSDLINYYRKKLGAKQIGKSQRMYISGEASLKLYNKYYGGNNER